MLFLRAFLSRWVKFLAYTTSKPKILAFNNLFYNSPNITNFIFFTISFKYFFYYFFILQLYFFLSLPLCHSQPSKLDNLKAANPYPPHPPPSEKNTNHPYPPIYPTNSHSSIPTPANPYPSQPPPLGKNKGPSYYLPLPNHKSTTITITKPRSARRKKKDRETNPSRRRAKHTHTHTNPPRQTSTKANSLCWSTAPRPTTTQTHNPETQDHADHNPKSQTHNPKTHTHTDHKPTTRPTPITIRNHKFTTHKIKSPRYQALPPYRRQHSEGIWALKFLTNEPWRGGAQTVNSRETEKLR